MIPFVNLAAQYKMYREELDSAISSVLQSGDYIGGKAVRNFEENLRIDTGCAHAISCASGTSALRLSLRALGLAPGDEVIVPDYTFIATAEAVVLEGGIPRFADVNENFLMAPESVAERISPKTVGIIAVDLFGQCADYPRLQEIAQKHHLWILEDAAQSFGATQNGKAAGSLATIAATSFYPTKPFGSFGDGGAVFTNDEHLAERVRIFARHGQNAQGVYAECGTNSRLDAIQAAILSVKRKHFPAELERRRKNAARYDSFFSKLPAISTPKIETGNQSIYAQYALRIPKRDAFRQKLLQLEIPTRIYYESPLSQEPCFARFKTAAQDGKQNPISNKLAEESLCLPICAFSDAESIIQKINGHLPEFLELLSCR